MSSTLKERAILIRLSLGLPGGQRQDPGLTDEIMSEHSLGKHSGEWVKKLYPPEALAGVKKVHNAVRTYHNALSLPWDAGIGILPVALYYEYTERMRQFKEQAAVEMEKFLVDPQRWVDWAQVQHNGTFDPDQYPGCKENAPEIAAVTGEKYVIDAAVFAEEMRKRFDFRIDPLPVPEACHFAETVTSLLGLDAASVDQRVADSAKEATRELMKRLIDPVKAMADKLAEEPKVGKNGKVKEDIVFRDSLIGNLIEICRIGPALNLSDDPEISSFIAEIERLSQNYDPDKLRADKGVRSDAQADAAALAKKMAGYKF